MIHKLIRFFCLTSLVVQCFAHVKLDFIRRHPKVLPESGRSEQVCDVTWASEDIRTKSRPRKNSNNPKFCRCLDLDISNYCPRQWIKMTRGTSLGCCEWQVLSWWCSLCLLVCRNAGGVNYQCFNCWAKQAPRPANPVPRLITSKHWHIKPALSDNFWRIWWGSQTIISRLSVHLMLSRGRPAKINQEWEVLCLSRGSVFWSDEFSAPVSGELQVIFNVILSALIHVWNMPIQVAGLEMKISQYVMWGTRTQVTSELVGLYQCFRIPFLLCHAHCKSLTVCDGCRLYAANSQDRNTIFQDGSDFTA